MEEIIIDLPRPRDKKINTTDGFTKTKRHVLDIMDTIAITR